jgi:hypothetical protein
MKNAEEIREFVANKFILPARQSQKPTVTVCSGDIHDLMGLKNRMPAVCSALDAKNFREQYGLELVNRSGPKQSSTVIWTFAL